MGMRDGWKWVVFGKYDLTGAVSFSILFIGVYINSTK